MERYASARLEEEKYDFVFLNLKPYLGTGMSLLSLLFLFYLNSRFWM